MSANWEPILEQFLTGEGSRADVESLRLRMDLAAEDRDEIEASLRLVDELAAAGDTIVVPAGAIDRLTTRLIEQMGEKTSHLSMPRWDWDGSGYRLDPLVLRPNAVVADEQIANALIEGYCEPSDDPGSITTGASDESNQQLAEFQKIIDALSDPAIRPKIPAGAEDRLTFRLREQMQDADQVDSSVARRILRQLKSCPLPSLFSEHIPDVLAATTDSELESNPPKLPENDK